jgi:citrate lyase beta subunit
MMLMVDILKAARIVFSFEHHDKLGTGAYELDGAMIDAPVYKQVCSHSSSFVKKGGGRLMIGIESNYES